MKSQEKMQRNSSIEPNPWFSDEDVEMMDSIGVFSATPAPEKSKIIDFQKAQELRELIADRNQQKIQPIAKVGSAIRDTRLKIDNSVSLLVVAAGSVVSTAIMGFAMMTQNPNAQVLALAQQNQILVKNSLNANAAIADAAVKDSANKFDFSLIKWGGNNETEPNTIAADRAESVPYVESSMSQSASSIAPAEIVATIPAGSTLNIRSSADGKVIGTIPGGDRVSTPLEYSNGNEWVRVKWLESNVEGWISYPVVYPFYNK